MIRYYARPFGSRARRGLLGPPGGSRAPGLRLRRSRQLAVCPIRGRPAARLDVTEADDDRTIETWTPNCPSGVNWQIILTTIGEPAGFLPC